MPPTRPSATTAAASPVKLRFDDKLTGRGLNSDSLQRKLKTLLEELSSITEAEPENIDLTTFATVRKDLINPSLILHKDKGVKAYVSCCIAELLNVYAPDAPYTAPELKDIFQFFFKQLVGGLKGPDAPYYQLYHDLLASLSRTKSAVLVCDLPQADELLAEIFKDFFTLAALALPPPIELYMADIMAALLDECQSVPSEVVDILIAQFGVKRSAASTPPFRVAVEVCDAASDKLVRPVCQYFSDTITQHHNDPDEDEDDEEGGRPMEAVQAAHNLVKRMHKFCPKLLLSVIPQLQEELSVDNVQIRILATQTLGEMYSHQPHGTALMREYKSTWVQWIARKNDKTPSIRIAFVEMAKKLVGNTDMRADIDDAMRMKIMDPDDRVRAAVCKAYGELDFETAAYHASETTLRLIGGRILDKKHTVRLEAFDALGNLYSHASGEIEKNNPTAVAQFGWIPGQLLDTANTGIELKVLVEETLMRYVLPLPSVSSKGEVDPEEWTRRLLRVVASENPRILESILALSGVRAQRPTPWSVFVEACLEYNGGVVDKDEERIKSRFNTIVKALSTQFPNPTKVEDELTVFAKHHDRRLYKCLKTCQDLQTDLHGLIKASNEFTKIVNKDLAAISTTMHIILRRSSLWLINTSCIETLLDAANSSQGSSKSRSSSPSKTPKSKAKSNGAATQSQSADTTDAFMVRAARRILHFISKNCPQLYYPHLQRLADEVAGGPMTGSFEVSLRALAAVASLGTDQAPHHKDLDKLMFKFATSDEQIHAKYAARYIVNHRGKEKNAPLLIDKLYKGLKNADGESLVAHISALSECALHAPEEFETRREDILRFLLQDLIFRDIDNDFMATDETKDNEWCPRGELNPLVLAKCQTMRLLANHCIAKPDDEKQVTNVTKLLLDTLDQDGSFSLYDGDEMERDRLKDTRESGAPARSWLRLKAAKCLLRMAQRERFSGVITARLPSLALVVQDFCWEVRNVFITKLTALLSNNKLSPIFNTIVFLTCHDVEDNVRQRARTYVSTQLRKLNPKLRLISFEMLFVRYLHLLAHHPDYDNSGNEEGLPALAKYIDFYLELVASSINVSLLYYLAQQCKTVRDKEGHTYSEHLYLLSELADYAIKQRAQNNGWTIPSYPSSIVMPKDIFSPLPSAEAAKKVRSTIYLTEEKIGWIGEIGKAMKPQQPKPARKRRAPGTSKPSKRPVKRRKKLQSDDDEEDEEMESIADDSDEETESAADAPAPTSDEAMSEGVTSDEDDEDGDKKFGRGARGRAKAKANHKTKKGKK